MANKAHLDCLKKGAAGWNRWRNENPEIIPDLREADLSETDFFGADLRNSELQQANFTQAKNLVNAQLGGANLSGATLPEDSLKFDGIYQVEHAIKYTQRIFVVMVLGCIYTWLTVASTSDANLITNSTVSPLPIIGNKIDIAGFYFVAPIILVCVYCYLHIYLQRLWERLAILPAFFPDGQPLDQKILPWFPTGLLYKHFVHLSKNAPPLARLTDVDFNRNSLAFITCFHPTHYLAQVFPSTFLARNFSSRGFDIGDNMVRYVFLPAS